MVEILLALVIGAWMLITRFIEYRTTLAETNALLADRGDAFEKVNLTKGVTIFFAIAIVFGFFSGILGVMAQDTINIALGIVITLMFLGEVVNVQINFTFYYSSSAFICRGKLVRFKSVKEIKRSKRIPWKMAEIKTFNNKSHHLPPKAAKIIEEHMKSKQ